MRTNRTEERLKNRVEDTVVFSLCQAKPQEVIDRELNDFKTLDHENQISEEQKSELARLERIQKLSKYYGEAVNLADKVSKWSRNENSGMRNCFVCWEDWYHGQQTEVHMKQTPLDCTWY